MTTTPPGAMVIIDNAPVGQTPTTLTQISPGDHLLIMRKSGYHEARTTITIRPGERITVDIKLEPLEGMLLIHSNPDSATVEINDANYGKTPLLITDFSLGKKRMRLSAQGYLPKTIDISVPDQIPQKIEVVLVPDSARVTIISIPAKAKVTIDGNIRGKTPCKIPAMASGRHKINITLKGYQPYDDTFSIRVGDSRKISVSLVPLPARLSVISVPEKARIYLNDQFKTFTPSLMTNIAPSKYIIRAELQGYETQTRTNTITSGDEIVVEFQFVKNSGTILLTTEPPDVSIYLDGENQGKTKIRGQELISAQFQLNLISKGQHKLQFTKQGYYDLTQIVAVAPNRIITIHKTLKRRPVPFVPNIVIRSGTDAEHTFKGIIQEKYENGDIKLEIEPGIFKLFRHADIISMTPIKQE